MIPRNDKECQTLDPEHFIDPGSEVGRIIKELSARKRCVKTL